MIAGTLSRAARLDGGENALETRFLYALGLLSLLRILVLFIPDLATLVAGLALVEAALSVVGFVVLFRAPPRQSSLYLIPLGSLIALGTVTGALYAIAGTNPVWKWFQYVALGLSWLIALQSGRMLGASLSAKALLITLLILGASDVLMLIPRIISLGVERRAPFGCTYILLGLIVLPLLQGAPRLTRLSAGPLVILGLAGAALSGMRTLLTITVVCVIAALVYVIRLRRRGLPGLGRRTFWVLVFGLPMLAAAASFTPAMETKIVFAEHRLERAIYDDDLVQDEADVGGRADEYLRATDEFQDRTKRSLLPWVFGYGHGFTYYNGFEVSAHVHITPVAFFVRYGIVGVLLYGYMFISAIRGVVAAWFRRATAWSAINLSCQVAVCCFWLNSLVGGVLVSPLAWLITGMADTMARRDVPSEDVLLTQPVSPQPLVTNRLR